MKTSKKYYQPVFSVDNRNAGSKATNDVIKILEEIGFHKLNNFNANKIKKMVSMLGSIFKVKKNDVVFFQYPLNPLDFLQHKLLKIKKIKSIAIVHDLPSIRNSKDIKEDIHRLNGFSHLIVHNECMEKLLNNNGIKPKMTRLELFDYITNKVNNRRESKQISFAGNLSKSGFIYELKNIGLNLNIYGNNYDKSKQIDTYFGSFDSNQIVEELQGEFGLVWDGNNVEDCSGDFGKYLKFISPHKASLYLVAGKALIVWEESALANYVVAQKIGFSVKSLNEIKDKITNLTDIQMQEININVSKIQKKLQEGFYLRAAVNEILNNEVNKNV